MKAKLLATEGDYLEATIQIEGKKFHVVDEFSGDPSEVNLEFDLEFSYLLDDEQPWESIFNSNPDKKLSLEHLNGWSYKAFGKIKSLAPMVIDCGIAQIEEDVVSTHDNRVVGEYISFIISRLGAWELVPFDLSPDHSWLN